MLTSFPESFCDHGHRKSGEIPGFPYQTRTPVDVSRGQVSCLPSARHGRRVETASLCYEDHSDRQARGAPDPALPITRQDRKDTWPEDPVLPDKCSASRAPIRKPDLFRAEGAVYSGGIDKRVRCAHADFRIPDQRSASPRLCGMTAGHPARQRRSIRAHSGGALNRVQMSG